MTERQGISRASTTSDFHVSRRFFVTSISLAGCGIAPRMPASAQTPTPAQPVSNAKPSGLLMQPTKISSLNTRCKIALELSGDLQIDEAGRGEKKSNAGIEVKAKSTLDYLEKIALTPGDDSEFCLPVAAARRYFTAEVENWVAGKTTRNKLRPDCADTRLLPHDGVWQQYCDTYPLDAREVQLLQSPINSAAIELLLPLEPAKPNSVWTIRTEDATLLFNLEGVHKSNLQAKISKVEKGVATIELAGELEATANSVPTHLEINGNFQVKFASRCALVTWLGLVIKEERQISQAEPGFNITARVRLIREESDNQLAVSDGALLALADTKDSGQWLVRLHSTAGQYSMLADRRWHIHRDSAEEAILRMVENNTIIAQCAVSRLSELEAGQQLTMEGLQADIKKSLGDTFREILSSSEKVTDAKLRMLRTVVAGQVDEVPIQWIYTHLSDDSGRRLAMVFTMGGNLTDRFGAADEQMAMSFEWQPEAPRANAENSPKTPAAPTKLTLPKLTAETKQATKGLK
jgi:hypothetical protein